MEAAVLRRFGFAFAATGLVVVTATVFRGEEHSKGAVPPVSSPNRPTLASPLLGQRRPLPRPDYNSYCQTAYGPAATVVVVKPDARGLRCKSTTGELSDIDVNGACRSATQRNVRAVFVANTSDGWRCTTENRVEVGQPASTAHCQRLHGRDAIALATGNDVSDWECAALLEGMWMRDSNAFSGGFDPICAETWGPEVFSTNDTGTPNGWKCYEAA